MMRSIRVTGKGKISVKPDRIRLLLNFEDVRKTYEETVEQSTKQAELLKDCFEKIGFSRKDLKTLTYNVDTAYENHRDLKGEWKRKFIGYKFKHAMKLEFDADNRLLGKVLYALAHCDIKPEVRIKYTIKDVESAKNQLLGNAMKDSMEKAKVLSEAAGVCLGEIQTIDYSWGEIDFVSAPMDRVVLAEETRCRSMESYNIDIEPDEIEVEDTVTVVWSI